MKKNMNNDFLPSAYRNLAWVQVQGIPQTCKCVLVLLVTNSRSHKLKETTKVSSWYSLEILIFYFFWFSLVTRQNHNWKVAHSLPRFIWTMLTTVMMFCIKHTEKLERKWICVCDRGVIDSIRYWIFVFFFKSFIINL